MEIRTIIKIGTDHFYISLNDTINWLIENNVFDIKKGFEFKKYIQIDMLNNLSDTMLSGEWNSTQEPVIISFADWFIPFKTLDNYLDDVKNEKVELFQSQFGYYKIDHRDYLIAEKTFILDRDLANELNYSPNIRIS